MGQCVLKDCGFEYQKIQVKKGVSFPEFFKEKMKEKKLQKQKLEEVIGPNEGYSESHKRAKPLEPFVETTKLYNHPPKFLDKNPQDLQIHDDMIIERNHLISSDNTDFGDDLMTLEKQPFKQNRKISEIGNNIINKNKMPKIRRLKLQKTLPSQNFTPLLDSLRDSLNQSPFQSKISLHEKYEKSSLFRAAQTNFQLTSNDMEASENSDIYENIFSDGDCSMKNSKSSGLLTPINKCIINVNTKD